MTVMQLGDVTLVMLLLTYITKIYFMCVGLLVLHEDQRGIGSAEAEGI